MKDQQLWNKLHRSQAKRRLELAVEACNRAYTFWKLAYPDRSYTEILESFGPGVN